MVKALALALLGLAGCDIVTNGFDTNGFSGDPYPVEIDATSGALLTRLQVEATTSMRDALIDVLAPLTLVDKGPDAEQEFKMLTLTLFDVNAVPRAQFVEKQVAILHPCGDMTLDCQIGDPATPRPFDAVVGMDAFASDALRLRLASSELFIFADIAGDNTRRSQACDAVFPTPFRGGGTIIFGGSEVSVPSRRIAIDTCIAPAPAAATQRERGLDALFVLSTAIGTSLINESTYARYLELHPAEPPLAMLPESSVLLPSGPVTGRLTQIPSIALVANHDSAERAPCRQVYASHLLEAGPCQPGADCPCDDNDTFCSAPAVVELAPPTQLPVLVVPDDNPTLQALRTELRPDRPEVDGILGTSALAALELDVDYANARVLARCTDRSVCGARVTLADTDARRFVTSCLGTERGPFP
jgi:hypothetical protein